MENNLRVHSRTRSKNILNFRAPFSITACFVIDDEYKSRIQCHFMYYLVDYNK